jgi:methionyl-tRNA synthetase
MNQALETLPADYWRWWLLSNAPEGSDTDFTWENFQSGVNKDLSDVLGNFVSRVSKFCFAKFGSNVPKGAPYSEPEQNLIHVLEQKLNNYRQQMNSIEIRKAASELRSIWSIGNEYLQLSAPWTHFKENPERAACIIRFSFNLIALYSNISRPFIPETSIKIDKSLKLEHNTLWPVSLPQYLTSIKKGHPFTVPDNLFEKLSDDQIATFKVRFSGDNET